MTDDVCMKVSDLAEKDDVCMRVSDLAEKDDVCMKVCQIWRENMTYA